MRGNSLNIVPDKPFILRKIYSFVLVAYLLALGRFTLIINVLIQVLLNIKLVEYFHFFLGYLNTSKYHIIIMSHNFAVISLLLNSCCISSTARRLLCFHLKGICSPEDGGRRFLRNVYTHYQATGRYNEENHSKDFNEQILTSELN
jgi:hypothetical protein